MKAIKLSLSLILILGLSSCSYLHKNTTAKNEVPRPTVVRNFTGNAIPVDNRVGHKVVVRTLIGPEPSRATAQVAEPAPYKSARQPVFVTRPLEEVFFDTNVYELSNHDKRQLDNVANWLRQHPNAHAKVDGFADKPGTREYNLKLSERRAESIRAYLKDSGVPSSHFTIAGHGYSPEVNKRKAVVSARLAE